jgi:AraC family transcriptional activator of pobA
MNKFHKGVIVLAELPLTPGTDNSLKEYYIPDLQSTIQLDSIHVRQVNEQWTYPHHQHQQCEINYVVEGIQLMRINGIEYRHEQGDIILLRPGDIHSSASGSANGFTYFCIHFNLDDKLLMPLIRRTDQRIFTQHSKVSEHIRPIIETLIQLASQIEYSIADYLHIQSTFFLLLAELGTGLSQLQIKDISSSQHTELAHRVAMLIEAATQTTIFDEQNDPIRLSVERIASQLGISPSHCNRIFKQVYGVPPRKYISDLILREAKALLMHAELPIDRISMLLGYRDIAHFSRQFKRWTSLSPLQYRQRN